MILLIDNYDSFSYNLFQMVGAIEPDIKVIRNDACSVEEIRAMKPSGVIISPGPGRPEDAGICIEAVRGLGEGVPGTAHTRTDIPGTAHTRTDIPGTAHTRTDIPGTAHAKADLPGADPLKEQCPGSGNQVTGPAAMPPIPILGVCLGHQSICAAYGARVGYAKELMHGKTSQCRLDLSSPLFAGLNEVEQIGRYHSLAAVEETMPDCLKVTARTDDGEIMAVEHREYPVYGIQFHPESILTPHGNRILENFVNLSQNYR